MQIDTTAGFCCLDDFCKIYEEWERAGRIGVEGSRLRDHMLSLSEMLLIMTMFHNSAYKDFKRYHEPGIKHEYAELFGQTPCHARFVALMKQLLVPFAILLHSLKGEETGVYFIDSSHKGYIGKELFTKRWRNGLQLIIGIRKTMKNYLMPWFDKVLLRKRFIIETLFDKLKSAMSLEHSRHRPPVNAFVHILSCLVAYCFSSNKPKIGTVISMKA